jgi:ribosomal protein S18 acetylase RimI-like enzyme
MKIKLIETNKKNFLDLLLLADESEEMIDKYLERGELFALYDDDVHADARILFSVCVVTQEGDDVCELKNIATDKKYHCKGYGSKLINHISEYYKKKYTTMLVGTGDVPRAIRFYEKNGFAISHRIKKFFTDNYDHPMFDEGVQLVDMVYLSKDLQGTKR